MARIDPGDAGGLLLTVYCYSRCSTCRKALKWLESNDIDVESVDITTAPPSADAMAAAIDRSGLPLRRFFNTSGQSYRGGGWKDKLPGLSVSEAAEALSADGRLIKRPLVFIASGGVLVGFKQPEWEAVLGC